MHKRYFSVASGLSLLMSVLGRNILPLPPDHETVRAVSKLQSPEATQTLMVREVTGMRCGPGVGSCTDGNCCSTAGFCGNSIAHCRSPDCQIDFGHCDAHATPGGPSTEHIPRPKIGNIGYGPAIIRSCTVPGTIALTYDDGPNQYTRDLLDLLDQYGAKVTFFVTGNNNGKGQIDSPDVPWGALIQRMVLSGHQVASHTWSHQDLDKISQVQRRTQMVWNEVALRNILGVIPTYMRPPYSSCTVDSGCLTDMGELGYHVILYDIDTEDYSHDSPDKIHRSKEIFDTGLELGKRLIIAHDVHEQTVHNLSEHMLKKIAVDGIRTVTVGECLGDPVQNWYRKDPNVKAPETSIPPPPPSQISTDGKCGENVSCVGSPFGLCCSAHGSCGNSTEFCGSGCQPDAGYCESDFDGSGLVGSSDPLRDTIASGKKHYQSDASSVLRRSSLLLGLVFLLALAML